MRILLILFLLSLITSAGDTVAQEPRSMAAAGFKSAPVIDGKTDDPAWAEAEASGDFIQYEPRHGEKASLLTLVKVGYDEDALYILIQCYDPQPGGMAASVTKRDGDLEVDDAVVVLLDTYQDNNNAYMFGTNLLGTQLDGRIADNGRSQDSKWDGAWSSAARRDEDGWDVEMRIPFRIIRFRTGRETAWGLNLIRYYPRRLEKSTWNGPVESLFRVSQFGRLTGLSLAEQRSKRYEVIPYAMFQAQEQEGADGKVGVDARYRLKSNLSADLTIRPDFATIEADVERINLSRFELRIPEKRPFFQEGAELFSQRISQFYSRRIGDIPWGAKLQGKIGSWDTAFIAAQSDPARTAGDEADTGANGTYGVFRVKRRIMKSSNIGFLAADRRWRGTDRGSIGVDATLFFTEVFGMTAQFVRAHGPENDGKLAWFVRPSFDSSNSHFHVRYSNWDEGLKENLNAVGFISDDDRREFDTNFTHTFWLSRFGIESIETDTNYNQYWSQAGVLRSWEVESQLEAVMAKKWSVELSVNEGFERFEKDFRNRETSLGFGYDTRTGRSVQVSYGFGRNYDSDLRLVTAEAGFKITDAWNASYELTRLWLDPDPEEETTWIHVLRSDYYFNKDFFVKIFYQTNSSIDKKNAQAVLVWRFIPPFGAIQFAYQHGSSRFGTASDQGHTVFTKLSWVF